jgi:hypothetical protein
MDFDCFWVDARRKEAEFTGEDLLGVWSTIHLAKEVGARVGRGKVLQ